MIYSVKNFWQILKYTAIVFTLLKISSKLESLNFFYYYSMIVNLKL